MIDPEKILPSWRFILSPEMERDAEEFRLFIRRDWVPYDWSDDKIKSWVEKRVIGLMHERWPMIYKIDSKLNGLVSKTLRLMCTRPRDMPPGYVYTFATAFVGITGPDTVQHAFKEVIDYKLKGSPRRFLEPGEEEYDDARMVALTNIAADIVHRDDETEVDNS
ncbi:hypothetical protein Kim5_CH00826 [Rhizobium sp. Kim5]|uniref:hypothetical protein n=1 Tax=Rhizobium sp. Kim5 TaxID=2020311 RepID=UPI00019030C2|nr:hypothetical protein [Rhizobium sp. Kim5]ARQ56933.1 hypothetical protein Kim5_CH00826 [Rhizobium sp. Kim5]